MAGTNPPLTPFLIAIISRVKGLKFYVKVCDVYPHALQKAKILSTNHIIYKILHNINLWVYAKAAKVFVLGRDMFSLIEKSYQIDSTKLKLIENWADIDKINGEICNRQIYNKNRKLKIGFVGNIGRMQGLDKVLRIFVAATTIKENVDFIVIGEGQKKDWLQERCHALSISNVTFLGAFPREEQNQFLSLLDIGFVSLNDGMSGVGVPSRAYNLLAAGKPLLGLMDDSCEIARIISEEKLGVNISGQKIEAKFIKFITEIIKNPALLFELQKNCIIAANKRSSSLILEKYKKYILD
jgi:colanic acid biosynthesis glycosyl transferase WcaI